MIREMPGTDKTKGKQKSKTALEKEFAQALAAAEKGERVVASASNKGSKEGKGSQHALPADEFWAAARSGSGRK
jgi:hypothetical protein